MPATRDAYRPGVRRIAPPCLACCHWRRSRPGRRRAASAIAAASTTAAASHRTGPPRGDSSAKGSEPVRQHREHEDRRRRQVEQHDDRHRRRDRGDARAGDASPKHRDLRGVAAAGREQRVERHAERIGGRDSGERDPGAGYAAASTLRHASDRSKWFVTCRARASATIRASSCAKESATSADSVEKGTHAMTAAARRLTTTDARRSKRLLISPWTPQSASVRACSGVSTGQDITGSARSRSSATVPRSSSRRWIETPASRRAANSRRSRASCRALPTECTSRTPAALRSGSSSSHR